MGRPLLVAEATGATSRRPLFRLFGVTWAATRYAWLGPFFWCGMGIALAAAERPTATGHTLVAGVGYGVLLFASNILHSLGHIAAGRLARAPMAVNVLTSTRDVNEYVQAGPSAPPARRVVRSLGGPAANVLAGLLALAAGPALGSRWVSMAGYFNFAIGLWTLVPVPSMDGWVIWRTIFRRGRGL